MKAYARHIPRLVNAVNTQLAAGVPRRQIADLANSNNNN